MSHYNSRKPGGATRILHVVESGEVPNTVCLKTSYGDSVHLNRKQVGTLIDELYELRKGLNQPLPEQGDKVIAGESGTIKYDVVHVGNDYAVVRCLKEIPFAVMLKDFEAGYWNVV